VYAHTHTHTYVYLHLSLWHHRHQLLRLFMKKKSIYIYIYVQGMYIYTYKYKYIHTYTLTCTCPIGIIFISCSAFSYIDSCPPVCQNRMRLPRNASGLTLAASQKWYSACDDTTLCTWLFCSILYSMLQCYIASIRCYSTI